MARLEVPMSNGGANTWTEDNSMSVTPTAISSVTAADGATIKNAGAGKNHSIFILVEATAATTMTFKKGIGPNSVLGDKVIPVGVGFTAIQLRKPDRFLKEDGSIDVDVAADVGMYVISDHAGIREVASQDTIEF